LGQRAFSSEFRDLLCPPVGAAVACSATGYGARHRSVASCAHVSLQAFRFLVDAAFLRCQLHADTVTAAWSKSMSLSFSRHLGVGGGRERLGPRVLLLSCLVDAVSEVSSIIMYRWSDSVSTSSATLQLRIRRCRLAVVHVMSTTEEPLHATHVLVEHLLVSRSPRPVAQSDSIMPRAFVRVSPHCEERALKSPSMSIWRERHLLLMQLLTSSRKSPYAYHCTGALVAHACGSYVS
jgi:hypothetical protein